MAKQTLGEFLSLLRKANGYTQQDVADKLNISNRTLSSWETDRTVPDILILPTLADLYGVTVDELLRGERMQPEKIENVEFSDKAKRSVRKNRFGKFSTKCSLLSGLALASEGILLLAVILFLFSNSPFWLDIILFIIGVAGIVVCISLTFYFANCLKLAEGLVLNEDLTEENYAFALAIKHKCSKLIALLAIPVWILTVLVTLLFLFSASTEDATTFYVVTIVISFILGLLPLISVAIYNRGFSNFANNKQIANNKYNKKLITKVCIFGSIPVLVFAILAIAFINPVITKTDIYKHSDFEQFKTELQTLTVTQDSRWHTQDGVPVGEYLLDFPDTNPMYEDNNIITPDSLSFGEYYLEFANDEQENEYYSLGNNFYGRLEPIPTFNQDNYENIWRVKYNKESTPIYAPESYIVFKIFTENEEKTVVNVKYSDLDIDEYHYYMFMNIRSENNLQVYYADGNYILYFEKSVDLNGLTMPLFIVSLPVCSVVCTVIYCVKRKKHDFNF